MVQYFTAPSIFYPNQESYDLTKDQSMGSFHVKNMETYKNTDKKVGTALPTVAFLKAFLSFGRVPPKARNSLW